MPKGRECYLARSMGSSAGISVVNTLLIYIVQVNQANIGTSSTAFNRHLATIWNPFIAGSRSTLDSVINQQAQIIAYNNAHKFLMIATLATLPLLLFVNKLRQDPPDPRNKPQIIAIASCAKDKSATASSGSTAGCRPTDTSRPCK